jgi:diguanylate cyclase (GGDEF)-like protein
MDKTKAYLEHIQKLLHDSIPPEPEEEFKNDPLLCQIHHDLTSIRNLAHAFSQGDFSPDITLRGIIPGCFKALQAHLRHLIWQVQMVEKGDFSQEVRFMGEFSDAFNSMTRRFHLSLTKLQKNEESLIDTNNNLRKEIERMDALKESEARFKFLADHDPLTGILNRRSFIEMVELMLDDAEQRSITCCITMMDIDHFKNFNDTYGHLAGDEALRHVVKIVENGLRKNDFVGRYGGEEFILFFFDTDKETGMNVLGRLRKKLCEMPVSLKNETVIVQASFGLVESPKGSIGGKDYVQNLIRDADTALYAAKLAGRNKVVLFSPELESRK